MSQLLLHRVRAAYNCEHSVFDLLPGIDVSQELVLVFQNRHRRLDRCITGRRDVDALQQLLGKIPKAWLKIPPSRLVGLGNVYRDRAAHLFWRRLITLAVASLLELIEYPLEDLDMKIRNAHVGIASFRDELHGFQRPDARNPDR